MIIKSKKDLKNIRDKGLESLYPDKIRFRVGMASCGLGAGGRSVFDVLNEARKGEDILLSKTGCIGACYAEPLVELYIPGVGKVLFKDMDGESARELVNATVEGDILKEKAFCRVEKENPLVDFNREVGDDLSFPSLNECYKNILREVPLLQELGFFKFQTRAVLRNSGYLDPEKIREYIARGGYLALQKSLEMDPDYLIERISKSRLRGRGGAGFPTGEKWGSTRKAEADEKYVIANGDEGDPGAYMDRVLLESDPHSILEGMIINAYAIGASQGYIFVRQEYPKAVERIDRAIQAAEKYGILGDGIMGSEFDFEAKIIRGGGAFVCGEETALMFTIEGDFPSPRPRPPYPTKSGLWGKPTCINNIETLANVPQITVKGSSWFAGLGTERSGGTKIFSLVGDVGRRGLIEVKLGTSLEKIVMGIGNADPNKTKAVQTGGPSGGFFPEESLDISLDFETLAELGSIMGSGGLVVVDDSACMVDLAKYFLDFSLDESCGQCTPCREGLQRLQEILDRIVHGGGKVGDLELLEELSTYIKSASLCGLGGTAPNPVLSTINHFEDEYREHIEDNICRAGICPMKEEID